MIRANRATSRRAGFTLVEVLVVIAIIAVLVSLTAAAVFKISGKGDELVCRHDISNLAAAIEAFKQQMKVDFIPSRIRLREDLAYNPNDQLDRESYDYLKKLFPKLAIVAPNTFIDWNGNGAFDQNPVDLEGHQCLVFFLGGIPSYNPNGVTGFSTMPSNPAATPVQAGTADRIGPFYRDFRSDRLVIVPTLAALPFPNQSLPVPGTGYFSYLDPWGQNPYAYFSAYKKVNGYNRDYTYFANSPLYSGAGPLSDCPSLTNVEVRTNAVGVWPYAQNEKQIVNGNVTNPLATYLNKDTYQIISAGPDKIFGQGSPMTVALVNGVYIWSANPSVAVLWSPQLASNQTPKGRDDFSNFHERQLGSGD